jgi:endogenous inhibitor of DNA gyrase (YacG/DUF329 family)
MQPEPEPSPPADLYCPRCGKTVDRPLICGDCMAVICRECGAPLERVDELGIG